MEPPKGLDKHITIRSKQNKNGRDKTRPSHADPIRVLTDELRQSN